MIDFAEDARVIRPMFDPLADGVTPRTLQMRRGRSYAAAFHLLRERLEADLVALRRDGFVSWNPVIIFLTDGPSTDGVSAWKNAYENLVDDLPKPPVMLVYGISGRPNSSDLHYIASHWSVSKLSDYTELDKPYQEDLIEKLSSYILRAYVRTDDDVVADQDFI